MRNAWVTAILSLLLVITGIMAAHFYSQRLATRNALTEARDEIRRLSDTLASSENARIQIEQQLHERDRLFELERTRLTALNQEAKQFQMQIDDLQAKNNECKNRLELMETQNKDLQERLDVRTEQVAELRTSLAECGSAAQQTENRLFDIQQRIEELKTKTAALIEQNDILQSNLNELKVENDRQQAQAEACARGARDLEQQLARLGDVNRDQRNEIAEFDAHRRALQERIGELEQSLLENSSVVVRTEARNEELQSTVKDLEQSLAAANHGLDSLQKKCSDLEQDLARRDADIEELSGKLTRLDQEKGEATVTAHRLKETYDALRSELKKEIEDRETVIKRLKEQLSVVLLDDVLFDFARASITAKGRETLTRIGEVLKKNEMVDIVVAGHTDNVPIAEAYRKHFPSNWELSAARAAAVVRFFQNQIGIDPSRMTVQGFSYYRAEVPNDTPQNRAANRRVEIFIRPRR